MPDTPPGVVGWARRAFYRAKDRAKDAGVPFTITVDHIIDVAGVVCPITHVPLDYRPGKGRGRHQFDSPSLDRLVPALGYVPGNVTVLSNRMNRVKSSATPEELIALGKWAGRHLKASEVVAVT